MKSISRLLIANRGEIACRIIRTAKQMGIHTIAVYSDADASALHVKSADEAHHIGPAEASKSYLLADSIIKIAKQTNADAIHPGYGFLSENAEFAELCQKSGIIFVGPPADAIRAMGLKGAAKALMVDANVPVVPGYHEDNQDPATLKSAADKIGYPVLIKAVAGGGGKGMRKVERENTFLDALKSAQREAKNAFGNDKVLIEKYIETPRHIEIQVFADSHGDAVYLFERDCSLQRRHQKVVEEAPAPDMPLSMRKKMGEAAVRAAKAIGYCGAGTIEFIADASKGLNEDGFYFMEMNTRLQVEHPITEMITGTDLVEWQLRVAAGEKLPKQQDELAINGHSMEVRLYAEDPRKEFLPQTGTLNHLAFPEGNDIRIETGVAEGDEISVYYDPMIAKIVVHGQDRDHAIQLLSHAIKNTSIAGLNTNLGFLLNVLQHKEFKVGNVNTHFIEKYESDLLSSMNEQALARAALTFTLWRYARYADQQQKSHDRYSPWNSTSGWRVNQPAEDKVSLIMGSDEEKTFTINSHGNHHRILSEANEFRFDVNEIYASGVVFKDGITARIHFEKGITTYMAEGQSIVIATALRKAGADVAGEGEQIILAPMPGKIIDVSIKAGDDVKKGQYLIIMEAMKMEYTLVADVDGTVETLTAKVGEQVSDSAVLAKIIPHKD